ncbi:MAG: RloB family protein [Candidatus Tritonobacter lacicola]|nr:RloB family protein [Candidatus Tritonobacter lacicola]
MVSARRKFRRRRGKRRYRKMYIIATEGAKSEPQYFDLFNSKNATIHIKCLKNRGHGRDPVKVLKELKQYINDEGIRAGDEAWAVVDRDQWTDEQLNELHQWRQSAENYGLAVSNPKFEYWLLLHFEEGSGVTSSRACTDRLLRYLPHYEKGHIEVDKLLLGIQSAITRAKQKDHPPCTDWPRNTGTTVYRLVEKLLS